MLELRDVRAGYDGIDVVRGISLEVPAGGTLSIVGPNGCGKSTLLKAIANLISFKGEITIGKTSLRGLSRREASTRVGLMSQHHGSYFSYSVFDTVMMGRYPHIPKGVSPKSADKEYVIEAISAVGMLDKMEWGLERLSGGQLQRVFLARTLAQQPSIILLDEPTNHLDLRYQLELLEYLHEWVNGGGRAVIGVMHDISLSLRLSKCLLVMNDGNAIACGDLDTTCCALDSAYGMDVAAYMRETARPWGNLEVK